MRLLQWLCNKGTCCRGWWPEFGPWDSHIRRRESAPQSCALTNTCMHRTCTHVTDTCNESVNYVHMSLAIPPFKANSFTASFVRLEKPSGWWSCSLAVPLPSVHAHFSICCDKAVRHLPWSFHPLVVQWGPQAQLSTPQHQAAPVRIPTLSHSLSNLSHITPPFRVPFFILHMGWWPQ